MSNTVLAISVILYVEFQNWLVLINKILAKDQFDKGKSLYLINNCMAIWVIEFSRGLYKIRKIFAKESTYSKEIRKLLNFGIWDLG